MIINTNDKLIDRVFEIFGEISAIPHGSGDMEKIADYCVDFAKKNSLEYSRDSANNVIIYKNAAVGYENAPPVILQGHLDMVCQKTSESDFDFTRDGLKLFTDGDLLGAENTTLGADNGIAVAYVLAILESDTVTHPYIEAVFTTDEEIGMLGAAKLNFDKLKSKKMINLDSEEDDTLTVSCAGGVDFKIEIPFEKVSFSGTEINISLSGLKGGHSGVEIDKNRVNADMLAGKLLNHLKDGADFELVNIVGGNKGNAIPNRCEISLCAKTPDEIINICNKFLTEIKADITDNEPDFTFNIKKGETAQIDVIGKQAKNDIIFLLKHFPNGVIDMSKEIEGLVETSLNLGILKTYENTISVLFALRSNKKLGMTELRDKLATLCSRIGCTYETGGYYPPWEFNNNSVLQKIYCEAYEGFYSKKPKIEAIHAGLECAVFADKIEGLDCVSMGPNLYDVHTPNERLSISSASNTFKLLLKFLEECK